MWPFQKHLIDASWFGIVSAIDLIFSFNITTLQLGQIKDDIFSITPSISIFTLRQKSISFLTSNNATSWGVVTTIAPVRSAWDKYVTADRCSSDVPVKFCSN